MVILLVAMLGLLAAAVLAFWPSEEERAAGTGPDRTAGHAEPSAPSSLEGVLTAQLVAGEITRGQYLRALEQIAARDEERHPMAVPWDARP
ncbi:hypothetical protein AB0G04_22480 [Actinoplanes sp. NPDC023801]|uniref:hypothetical protein n=1 Tax=Actinoplanes sp. NPDC023801 TaxID=3154595 RepID=UPI0033CD625B